ncbi:MAG TPA: flagellin [Rhizomicrobium sp.]|jgi:flagellar hook-associated protein 3 FlgL|nr:flagellin [Rhizomicrobium sp.]
MTVDRISTAAQAQYFLTQIQQAGSALDQTQQQIASGVNASTYAGFGDKAQVLTASIAANARNTAYQTATSLATTQTDMQDTQLTSLQSLAAQLNKSISDAVANNDASTLMTQAQSIFEQATSILNSKDANGDYIYSGGKTDVPPVTVNSLSDLAALPGVSDAFANGDDKKSVQVADGVSVSYGVTASDAGTGLMQALSDLAQFDAGTTGNFSATSNLTGPQTDYLSGAIASTSTVANDLSTTVAQNGYVYNRLTDAQTQQGSMSTLYSGFISNIQDTNMANAATQLSLNQTQLQAALGVTSQLNQLSLLNYLPVSSTG